MNSNLIKAATYLREHHLREVILGVLIAPPRRGAPGPPPTKWEGSGSLLFDPVTKNWRLLVNVSSQYDELVKYLRSAGPPGPGNSQRL